MHDPEDVQDLVQEAFSRLAKASRGGELRTPAAYLQRIARNLLHDRSRARRKSILHVPIEDSWELAEPPAQSLAIEAQDLMACYEAALMTLTPRTREVFLLHRVDELTYAAIAARLDISVATVEYHMSRALVRLDEVLSE